MWWSPLFHDQALVVHTVGHVVEPIGAWIQNDLIGGDRFDYVAHGMDHHSLVVEQR